MDNILSGQIADIVKKVIENIEKAEQGHECKDGCVILTDLMERSVAIQGQLESANLVDGFVIVRETE